MISGTGGGDSGGVMDLAAAGVGEGDFLLAVDDDDVIVGGLVVVEDGRGGRLLTNSGGEMGQWWIDAEGFHGMGLIADVARLWVWVRWRRRAGGGGGGRSGGVEVEDGGRALGVGS